MPMTSRTLSLLCQRAHDRMRDVDGLLPQEAFDELLKYLCYKSLTETQVVSEHPSANIHRCEDPATIRERLSNKLASQASWALQLWPGGDFHISDRTLLDLQHLFADVRFTELPLDVCSTALSTFLPSDVRRGLGIFPTPEGVVRAMVEVVAPTPDEVVLDPACGTGTFLTETARLLSTRESQTKPLTLYGIDKNPRMLLLADLNLQHKSGLIFRRACFDSLRELGRSDSGPFGLRPNTIDVILTNPPFGVTVSRDTGILTLFEPMGTSRGQERDRVPSEILFIKLCFRLLRPEGRLGIVLPRSVITNERAATQRRDIDQIGCLTEIVDLPPETFASTGTQTTTVAAFFRKHPAERREKGVSVHVCHVTNVGVDATGRHRQGNQLPGLAAHLAAPRPDGEPTVTSHPDVVPTETLQRAATFLFRRNGSWIGYALHRFVELATTGLTPPRSAYTEDGTFILKVGNLTGRGIDWEPRDRNFVSHIEAAKRAKNRKLSLREGDVVLTSSAHAARYIAKKVDIVARIPEGYEGATFVGEVIRLRPADGVDPFVLLAVLRQSQVRADVQACVRGQTAHLNPGDLLDVLVPLDLRAPGDGIMEVARLLRREADLAFELNSVASRAAALLESAASI